MGEAGTRVRGEAGKVSLNEARSIEAAATGSTFAPTHLPAYALTCNRCGFEVQDHRWGCKNRCSNCGTMYPLGDCSD